MSKLKNQTKNIISIAIITLASLPIWLGAVVTSNMIEGTLASRIAFGSITTILTLAILYGVLHFYDKKPLSFIFGSKNLRAFFVGAGFFIVPTLITLVAAMLLGFIEITPQASFTNITGNLIALAALVFISEALPEELIFRGYVFKKLSSFTRAWATIAIQAALFLLFAFLIGAISDPVDASFLFTFAIVLGILRAATGSVWAAIGFHLACMLFQQGFGTTWSLFTVSDPSMLQTFILGMIPFSVTIGVLYSRINWKKYLN